MFHKTRKLALDAMLAAMCAVLGYLSLDFGNLKITFESLPILVGALLFGASDGAAIAGVGTLIYQLIRYGITVTTPLWILPYVLGGLLVGFYARRRAFALSQVQTIFIVTAAELMITVLNTGALYIDSHIFGYYTATLIYGVLALRLGICVVKALAFAFLLPPLLKALQEKDRGKPEKNP